MRVWLDLKPLQRLPNPAALCAIQQVQENRDVNDRSLFRSMKLEAPRFQEQIRADGRLRYKNILISLALRMEIG